MRKNKEGGQNEERRDIASVRGGKKGAGKGKEELPMTEEGVKAS